MDTTWLSDIILADSTNKKVYRRIQHLVFWALTLLILLNIFKSSGRIEKIDVIYTLIFMVPLVGFTYLNLYWLIPVFLRKERYLYFGILFALTVVAGAVFLYFLFDSWIDLVLPNYYFISYYSIGQLMIYTGTVLVVTTLLKLSRSWFMLLRMERITTGHRLQSLQSQINPHFLLNSLQTIYALSLESSERTPDVILKLADILKYTLYETEHPRISLEQEIRLVTDYVEMYRFRVDPVRAEILLEVSGDPDDLFIAPMLLIPFIENSFKHGLSGGEKSAFIHIRLKIDAGRLEFEAVNSMGEPDPLDPDRRKGIGIENTRQRLELLYPGRHSLMISREENRFGVNLKIQLNP
jgi:sensor histidine kinase YesM